MESTETRCTARPKATSNGAAMMQSTFEYHGHRVKVLTVRRKNGWAVAFCIDESSFHHISDTTLEDEAAALAEGEDLACEHVALELSWGPA